MHKINDKIIAFLDPNTIEPQALEQLQNISELPFIYKHVAVMPDCHLGKGATVGSVIATKGAIIPAAVGVDIGCGMIAVKTSLTSHSLPDNLDAIRDKIEQRIPTGKSRNTELTRSAEDRLATLVPDSPSDYPLMGWVLQLGSLGGGNHFIELSLDENDSVWVVLHSGSRGIGNSLASKHIKIAQELMDRYFIVLKDKDLAYLPQHTHEFSEYIEDLLWAQRFAYANRDEMMDRVLSILSLEIYNDFGHEAELELERINCHHNFTQQESHMGHNVWVTRKGAIQMRQGQMGVIPGSMGTKSYIVSGLENTVAFHSAPHGAGRNFSRTEARKRFTMEDMAKAMEGVSYRHDEALLDEIPGAYKDIDVVMENSKDLVTVHHVLKQIVNVKGD